MAARSGKSSTPRLAAGALALLAASGIAAANPQRIVSINVCADALVLELASRAAIASVTFMATDPYFSPRAEEARGIPVNHGQAEEVIAFQADLVVVGQYSGQNAKGLLRALGYPVFELELPVAIPQVREQIRRLAAALGESARGEALIARLDARLSAAQDPGGSPRPLAVIYQPNGFTLGRGSLADELLTWAGIDNLAAQAGIRFWGRLPLEQLLLAEPDLLIFEQSPGKAPALAQQLLAHPALQRLRARVISREIPNSHWTCPGPWLADAAESLAEARRLWSVEHAVQHRRSADR